MAHLVTNCRRAGHSVILSLRSSSRIGTAHHAEAPLYKPRRPSCLMIWTAPRGASPVTFAISPCICNLILTTAQVLHGQVSLSNSPANHCFVNSLSSGFVKTTCEAPAVAPAIISQYSLILPVSGSLVLPRTRSFIVSLIAFSGATP